MRSQHLHERERPFTRDVADSVPPLRQSHSGAEEDERPPLNRSAAGFVIFLKHRSAALRYDTDCLHETACTAGEGAASVVRYLLSSGWLGGLLLLLLGFATGCAARAEYAIPDLQVDRSGWDTLQVDAAFVRKTLFGGTQPVEPDTATVHLFDAAYDTLYAGAGLKDHRVLLPDKELGDRERILVEACGAFAGQKICEQEVLRASPKRVRVQHDISYPEGEDFRRGRYDLHFTIERQAFGEEDWEPIHSAQQPQGYLLAYLESRRDETVKVPLAGRQGRFNLAQYDGFKDFEFYLQSSLFDGRDADVVFDVYAGLGPDPEPVASTSKVVRVKTREERAETIRHLAQQAIEQVVERLGAPEDSRVVAYVDRWDFNRFGPTYRAEMEVRWRGGGFFRGRYILEGTLKVEAAGTSARFERTGGNRRAEQLWNDVVGGATLRLEALDPEWPEEEEEEQPSEEELEAHAEALDSSS